MGLFKSLKNAVRKPSQDAGLITEISTGRASVSTSPQKIAGSRTKEYEILTRFRNLSDTYDRIDYVLRLHPDANMAHTSMLRLSYNGGDMRFLKKNGKPDAKLAELWRVQCQSLSKDSNDGFDGVINQFHNALLRYGSLNFEVVVDGKAEGVNNVAMLHPRYIEKEYDETRGGYIDIQKYQGKEVQLTDNANYFCALLDSDISKPVGSLIYESALGIIDTCWQFNLDLMQVVRRVGYPRNDLTVSREAVYNSLPVSVRNSNSPKAVNDAMNASLTFISGLFNDLEPTQDMIHYDDVVVQNTSSDNSRTIDARAIWEILDPQLLNGLGTLGIFLNRAAGKTETFSTVEYKIVTETCKSLQRISKRAAEYVAAVWLAAINAQATPVFAHYPIDYMSEIQRNDLEIKRNEIERQREEYGWQDKLDAVERITGKDKLPSESDESIGKYRYLSKDFTKVVTPNGNPEEGIEGNKIKEGDNNA